MLRTILVVFVLVQAAVSWKQFLTSSDCSTIYYVNDDKSYQIDWTAPSTPGNCDVSFHGYDEDNVLNKYKICIRASTWAITDPNLKLKYYSGSLFVDVYPDKTYTKNGFDSPTLQWCADSDDYVNIKLSTTSSNIQFPQSVTLQVTAVMTYNYYSVIGWSVGGTIGGVVFIIVIVTAVVVVSCRRRRMTTGTVLTSSGNSSTIITQSGSQQMSGGISNPGYPANYSTPANYPPTGNYAPPPTYSPPGNQYPSAYPAQPAGVHQGY